MRKCQAENKGQSNFNIDEMYQSNMQILIYFVIYQFINLNTFVRKFSPIKIHLYYMVVTVVSGSHIPFTNDKGCCERIKIGSEK